MIYLILFIVFSSLFTLLIKWSQIRGRDDVVNIGAVNYIMAAVLILPFWILRDDAVATSLEFRNAILTGGSMGSIYFVAFFFVIYLIRKVGASPTTVVSVLSILMPITFAAMFWKDKPNSIQIAGIVLALASLILIGVKPAPVKEQGGKNSREIHRDKLEPSRGRQKAFAIFVLLGFFLLCGLSRMAQEAFKYLSVSEERTTYLLAAFTMAGIPSALLLGYRWWSGSKQLRRTEFLFGLLLGISNLLQTQFILQALQHFPGFIVFPVTSAGAIILTTIVATMVLGERLSRQAYIGIAIAVVALFMLNWLPATA